MTEVKNKNSDCIITAIGGLEKIRGKVLEFNGNDHGDEISRFLVVGYYQSGYPYGLLNLNRMCISYVLSERAMIELLNNKESEILGKITDTCEIDLDYNLSKVG